MRRETLYQSALILLGFIATALFAIFFYREIAPEYLLYQKAYVALEEFRSEYTGEPPPDFKLGIKQIVIPSKNKGPEVVDRCISCHVALKFESFSPTKIAQDLNGNIIYDEKGIPLKVANPDYIWGKLDGKIAALKQQQKFTEAVNLEKLKTAEVGEAAYDMRKVLAAHPLIGKETRPFEFHAMEQYGCTSCHNGNGLGLVTDKAHGPVFDGQYKEEEEGFKPKFLENDPSNDPLFSRIFNAKPSHELLFQTSPLYVGGLIEAKCVQCHLPSSLEMANTANKLERFAARSKQTVSDSKASFENDKEALLDLLALQKELNKENYSSVFNRLEDRSKDYTLPEKEQKQAAAQLNYLKKARGQTAEGYAGSQALKQVSQDLSNLVGSEAVAIQLQNTLASSKTAPEETLEQWIAKKREEGQTQGLLFSKAEALDLEQQLLKHVQMFNGNWTSEQNNQIVDAITSDIDNLTKTYQYGRKLYLSQACYACHKIAGFARGGVGPELTTEGMVYPWFVKESIVWPQADLRSSTMPNMRLDHEELEALVTFLLAQRTDNKQISDVAAKIAIKEWETGQKMPWEKPLTAERALDVKEAMYIFTTEGCASCHRLKGFTSNVGYSIEKGKPSFDELYKEKNWFQELFPEDLLGSQIVMAIEKNRAEIEVKIAPDVRHDSILEWIEQRQPEAIEGLYANFKYAARAKNHYYQELAAQAKTPEEKQQVQQALARWKETVRRVLMMYVQEYGLGRLIGPRPNWSGIYRSDEWLMEHFWNPGLHVPRSIMPVFPFDDSKFKALTRMLDELGLRNNSAQREVWQKQGFNPAQAFAIHCSQCHGEYELGNGPVAEWIYPIPKNLRNATFLKNLTKERAAYSIKHGVKGTPMPPWGEIGEGKEQSVKAPVLSDAEIQQLVNWLYQPLPLMHPEEKNIPKWQYEPEDVIKDLHKEGQQLKKLSFLETGLGLIAALDGVDTRFDGQAAVNTVFDKVPATKGSPDPYFYYIKPEYYTPENLKKGEAFFNTNCAYCHGKDADGSGARAASMRDAKPRMLTNLDWIQSRDDMRLIRSIKYGVPGTAMTPWGDLTSSLQRLQLVMYIRSLSARQIKKEQLLSALYQTFDEPLMQANEQRAALESMLFKLQQQQMALKKEKEQSLIALADNSGSDTRLIGTLQKEKKLNEQAEQLQQQIERYHTLGNEIKLLKALYNIPGQDIISSSVSEQAFPLYAEALSKLNVSKPGSKEQEALKALEQLLNTKLQELSDEIAQHARMQNEEVELKESAKKLEKLKARFLTSMSEANAKQNRIAALYRQIDSYAAKLGTETDNEKDAK